MINDTVIKDYAEYYDDCDSFPADDFIEAFEQA